MKIAIVSDTHGRCDQVISDLLKRDNIELLIHLGDMVSDAKLIQEKTGLSMHVVRGNNDYYDENTPWKMLIRLEGHKILLTHGHHERVGWSNTNLIYAAKEAEVDMVFYGHTHVYDHREEDGIRLLNPGSAGYDRGGEYESYVIMDISKDNIEVERIRLWMGVKLWQVTILRHDTTSTNEVKCESMSGPSSSND